MSSLDSEFKTVLVTGANGYVGNAVARSFVRAGWTTYGLVRQFSLLPDLALNEIIPLHGSIGDHTFVSSLSPDLTFDVIVSATEQTTDYVLHYNEIISLLTMLSKRSIEKGKSKPLVLFTSGSMDYGVMDALADTEGLKAFTEESPINPPLFARRRATYAIKVFEHADLFDAAVLRPTFLYGFSCSLYGEILKLGQKGKETGVLKLNEHPKTILHAIHVDDCGDAYVALAEHPRRVEVAGECFNISSWRFETLEEIAEALMNEYGIQKLSWDRIPEGKGNEEYLKMLIRSSQWNSSDKLRKLTGWRDHRQLFSKGLKWYRLAYEVAVARGYEFSLQKVIKETAKN